MGQERLVHSHPPWELCAEGKRLYSQALFQQRLLRLESGVDDRAPCLLESKLLVAVAGEPDVLKPVPPGIGLNHLLRPLEDAIARERTRIGELSESFAPFFDVGGAEFGAAITLIEGRVEINAAIDEAVRKGTGEMLTMQPVSRRVSDDLGPVIARMSLFLDNGGSMRTLYPHATRDDPRVLELQDYFRRRKVAVRTVDEVIDRIIIVGTEVAFIPGNAERSNALCVRHPALLMLLRSAFDRLWRYGQPFYDPLVSGELTERVTEIQLRIARFMILEGLRDEDIAARLGVAVRTVRKHIGTLSNALGANNRAQLGFMLIRSNLIATTDDLSLEERTG